MSDQKEDSSASGSDSDLDDAGREREQAPDWLIENIAELSKNTRSLYLIYLGALLYCAVTVVGVTDRQMLLDEAVTLPLIGVGVPLTGFFVFAPVVLIATFVYLQLYLQDLQSQKREMRAKYGKEEPGRLYPWIMNVVDHPQPGIVGWLQKSAVKVVLWWLLPIVLFLFGFSYLKMQEPVLGAIITAMPLLALGVSLFFWYRYDHSEEAEAGKNWVSLGEVFTAYVGTIAFGVLVFLFVSVAWMGAIPDVARGLTTIDVSYQSLVTEQKYVRYWVDLSGKKLRGADLEAATLINSDLSDTRLNGANLSLAKLDSADLSNASLNRSNLSEADASNANLSNIDLSHASAFLVDLSSSNLYRADLSATDLWLANLSSANLEKADLVNASLSQADISDSDLYEADLSGANLNYADLSNAFMWTADLSNANLQSADLSGTNAPWSDFLGADLSRVSLKNSLLWGADFSDADLSGADLSGTDFLCARLQKTDITEASTSARQLCEAATLFEFIASSEIMREVESQCPARLLDPGEDESLIKRCPNVFVMMNN